MMARGVPNLAKRDLRNLQITRALLVGSAFASTHFDKYSTTTSIYLFPHEDWNDPMKSMPQMSKISQTWMDFCGISSRREIFP
nr:hypothetical protein [Tanacetum cinerariifolium]